MDNEYQQEQLAYYLNVKAQELIVPIDEDVREPAYYRGVIQGIADLSENDSVRFDIASGGGNLSGLEAVLSALQMTQAQSVANILGECHSAVSILALNCDVVQVSPHATMLVHYVSYGSSGHADHIVKHVEHNERHCSKLFRNTYKYFLTEKEIEDCIHHTQQLWLDYEDIIERLERRVKLLTEELENEKDCCS